MSQALNDGSNGFDSSPRLLLTPNQASVLLKVPAREVLEMAKAGDLPVAATTPGGHRRYDLQDVLAVRKQRTSDETPA